MKTLYLVVPLAPLAGALIAGLLGWLLGRRATHWVAIICMTVSTVAAFLVFRDVLAGNTFNGAIYTWITTGDISFEIGFLIDRLSATMMLVVTFVSLMVHIYTIGYMADDPGYQRFFSYISLFTFSMLMLVMSNNFLQLFFGWEAVGLVSYLLIGFWYTRPSAIYASLKAFLVNRVGDFGFVLGIALIFVYCGSLDYAQVFARAPELTGETVEMAYVGWPLLTTICILLFIGAMAKSAQFPLHVWLPDSMEGPTPISALIHAATMVTAGIFMVARMSPLFELSETALSFVMVIGAITALSMALVAVVQNDIKRVVAYSTLSQLGYMTVALGASAFAGAIFHLATHAFFKALLFLGAGSVIIALHHEQDMRKMGGLRKHMPITYATMLIGALASAGIPGFSGFFSKDAIIEAVHLSQLPGSGFAHFCVLSCVFVTAFYTFRLFFMTFHGKEHFQMHGDDHGNGHGQAPHESPWVVTVPLVILAVPTICAGWVIGPVLFGGYFGDAIVVAESHDVLAELGKDFHGVVSMMAHALATWPFWLAVAGIASAAYLYLKRTDLPDVLRQRLLPLYTVLDQKYYFDRFNDWFFADGARLIGHGLWKGGDVAIIDGFVNGSARLVGWLATVVRKLQSGYVYTYAFAMIIGMVTLLTLWFARS
ncbi:MAG TPA: NADH-quinone oxidoreductase subunit L [Burkholderiales bacterium]|nr:NADH-quinone oxidoreductase subunit L [Burkholderiales bacterium]